MLEKYTPLYLKYRPQSLAELVGQHSVAQTLINAIEHDRICHAYLFTGPRGTGKTSSARILAKSLNCEKGPTVTPCQTCAACVEIKDGNSPAVFELDAASNNSVDDARALIERAPLVAQGGRHKLYIIDECHMLTKEAFNALLKTIEEPPPGVIFVLATTEEHKVPPTIVSRCQRLMFKLVNQDELKEHLKNVAAKESINIDNDALELVARRSGGGLRDALGLLDQAGLLSTSERPVGVSDLLALLGAVQEDVLLEISAGVRDKDGSRVLASIHSLLLDGREPAVLIQEMAKHFLSLARSCYNLKASKSSGANSAHAILGSPSYIAGLSEQAHTYDPAEIAQIVELLDKLEQNVRRSSQPAMNLEMGLLSICHRHEIRMMQELEERLAKLERALTENGIDMNAPSRPGSYAPARAAGPAQSAASSNAQNSARSPEAPRSSSYAANPTPVSQSVAQQQMAQQAVPYQASPIQNQSAQPVAQAAPTQASVAPTAAPIAPPAARPMMAMGDDDDAFDSDGSRNNSEDTEPDHSLVPPPAVTSAPAPDMMAAREEHQAAPIERAPVTAPAVQAMPAPSAAAPAPPQPTSRSAPPQEEPAANSHFAPSGGGISSIELDQMWSDITDALQGRHLPTYSILTTHAFPVSFEKNDLVIGVRKEQFQKMIENKAEHVKTAFLSVSGKTISVRVKVVADEGFAAAKPGVKSGGSSTSARESRPKPSPSDEESERGGERHSPPTRDDSSRFNSQPQSQSGNDSSSMRDSTAPSSTATLERPDAQPARQSSAAAPRRTPNAPDDRGGPSQIGDAYKIFEGPGSKLL